MAENLNLLNRSILIGKDPAQGRLMISVMIGGEQKAMTMGTPDSVPNHVSRCKPNEGIAHCALDIDGNGRMLLTNLKEQNVTYVNGTEIETKYITENDRVELGYGRYVLDIAAVLASVAKVLKKEVGKSSIPKVYNIDHLKTVQDEYKKENEATERYQSVSEMIFRIPMLITAAAGTITMLLYGTKKIDGAAGFVVTSLPFAVMLYGSYRKFFKPASKRRNANNEKFKKNYVCPHPECRRTLKAYDFDELLKIKKCPYCGSIFKSEM